MSNLAEMKQKFFISDEAANDTLEELLVKALPHCAVHKNGSVELKKFKGSARDQVKLILTARLIASKLDEAVVGDVTVDSIADYLGLPKNQAAARAKECVDEKFADRVGRGTYRARLHRLEDFLDSITKN